MTEQEVKNRFETGYVMSIYGTYPNMIEQMREDIEILLKAISVTRCSTQLPNIYEGTLNNDRIKIIRTLADNYNVNIYAIRSLFNDGADFYKQTLTK